MAPIQSLNVRNSIKKVRSVHRTLNITCSVLSDENVGLSQALYRLKYFLLLLFMIETHP